MFVCEHCNRKVSEEALGTRYRNHCPYCLYGKHLDVKVGDRQSECKGLMEPIGLKFKNESGDKGELMVVHRCLVCEEVRSNRIAGDDRTDSLLKVFEKGLESKNSEIIGEGGRREVLLQLKGKPWVLKNYKPK